MKIYQHPSPAQDSRIRHLVLHYTVADLTRSLDLLAGPTAQVSAHYLVADTPEASGEIPIYELVKPEQRAWHAGVSSWQRINNLNFSSIGIEVAGSPVNETAQPSGVITSDNQRLFKPFDLCQLFKLDS